jgi:hypothetical protein
VLGLRRALERQSRTALLFAGTYGSGLARLAGSRADPFALPLGLLPPDAAAWQPYLRRRLQAAGVSVGEAGLARLLERTGGHAYDLMAVCRLLGAAGPRRQVEGAADADDAVDAAMAFLAPLLRAEAACLGPVPHGVLHRLASGRHIYRDAGPPATIKRAVDALVAGGILRRAQRGSYAFTEPLLAEALAGGA